MSHFTTLVALDKSVTREQIPAKLDEVLAKWDENVRVPERRVYVEGSPEQHWSWRAVMVDVSTTHRERWNEPERTVPLPPAYLDARAATLALLGDEPVTWEHFVPLSNARWECPPEPPANLPATEDGIGQEDKYRYDRLYYDAELGRAYELTTYNPDSKWDWWTIGGRWRDYFPVRSDVPVSADLIDPGVLATRCNGGRKYMLDLDKMLTDAIAKANVEYDLWETMRAKYPEAKGWTFFAEQIGLIPKPDPDDKAAGAAYRTATDGLRQAYRDQPLIKAFEEIDETHRWAFDCPVDYFNTDREHFVVRHRNAAVPGFALVTKRGEWMAPGEMGWWAMSSDTEDSRAGYHAVANQYIADEVHDQDWLILLDLHI